MKRHGPTDWIRRLAVILWLFSGTAVSFAQEAESVCAEVRIEIVQEVSLERQAFDARMVINNNLPNVVLDKVTVDVIFEDGDGNPVLASSNPADTNALFFITVDDLSNISDVSGSGMVSGGTSAQVNWLIIPSAGAGGSVPSGTRYLVGAQLSYELNGEEHTLEVLPDSIFVKPTPRLKLDYFLPEDVFADDPFTVEVEPPEPFTLGVRVGNNGFGPAKNLSIDSGQPEIVENELGLLIGFKITGTRVNDDPVRSSLLADFGRIDPEQAGVARWTMETTLSGSFVDFTADFSHADEFGGKLTTLIDSVDTHTLIRNVLVDLPGRDRIRDFLAEDGGTLNVYESENVDSAVTDVSGASSLSLLSINGDVRRYALSAPSTGGPMYAKMAYTSGTEAVSVSAFRSDGKTLSRHNFWVSKQRDNPTNDFDFFMNVFDVDGGGTYTLTINDSDSVNLAPVLDPVGDRATRIGDPALEFTVTGTDPNGSVPTLSATPLPPGASLTDITSNTTAEALFSMTPPTNSAGVYPVRFTAFDGELADSEVVKIYVGGSGEGFDSNGIPNSLTNWAPRITDVLASTASGISTVIWESVSNINYDVYASDDSFESGMAWSLMTGNVAAVSSSHQVADASLGTVRDRRFYQVRLSGDAPTLDEVWGVIRKTLQSGYTLMSAPLRLDRRLDGRLGEALAAVLQGDDGGVGDDVGDEIVIVDASGGLHPVYLDSGGVWRESGGTISALELAPGQGFIVGRHTHVSARVTLTGKVGNDGTQTNVVTEGWNLVGLSEGRNVDPIALLGDGANGGPKSGQSEQHADLLILLEQDGTWTRYMFVQSWGPAYDGMWINLETGGAETLEMEPGDAFYYFRTSGAGIMEVTF